MGSDQVYLISVLEYKSENIINKAGLLLTINYAKNKSTSRTKLNFCLYIFYLFFCFGLLSRLFSQKIEKLRNEEMRKSNVSAIERGRPNWLLSAWVCSAARVSCWLAGRRGGRRGVIWGCSVQLCGSRGSGHAIEGSGVCCGSSIIGHTV